MAAETVNQSADGSGIPADRLEILNEANYQSEALLAALIRGADSRMEDLPWLIRGIGMRLDKLNVIVSQVCSDDPPDIDALRGELWPQGARHV